MHFLLINHIKNARQSLHSSRVRSALTMLGVGIGVTSITLALALSSGASKVISDQVDALGGNIAIIRPGGVTSNSINDIVQPQATTKYVSSPLSETDIASIHQIAHVKAIAPLMMVAGSIKADSVAPNGSPIVAATPQLVTISKLKLSDGQFLDNSVNQDTVVVGKQLSINIFGTESSIGRTLTIKGKTFTVIGVLSRTNNPINYNLIDFDNAAIINFASGKELNQNIIQIQQIDVMVDSVANLKQAVSAINKILLANHKGETDFTVLTGSQISQPTSQLFYIVANITAIIAAISLIVGGISIMNIMLMTVAERTREIGIRKALGANNTDISLQFLIEALIISIGGGIGGYIFGYIAAFGISVFLTFDPVFSWQIAATAITISLSVGVLFGTYPAYKASRKDPIESLHRYN